MTGGFLFASDQLATIQALGTVSGSLSVISILYVSRIIYKERATLSIASKLVAVLLFIDFGLSICYAIGRSGSLNPAFCQFQVI